MRPYQSVSSKLSGKLLRKKESEATFPFVLGNGNQRNILLKASSDSCHFLNEYREFERFRKRELKRKIRCFFQKVFGTTAGTGGDPNVAIEEAFRCILEQFTLYNASTEQN